MIKPNSKAFNEITLCALYQDIFEPIECDEGIWIDFLDYLKIKDLKW